MNSFLLGLRMREFLAAFFLASVTLLRGALRLARWLVCAVAAVVFGAPVVAGACLAVLGIGLALVAWASGRFIFGAAARL